MATVRQPIGIVKGERGDTGPTNAVIATVYTFQVTQSPEIPTDGWQSIMPEVAQGDYVWCRTQCTWQEGPDTTLIAVGYMGKDGDIGGIEIFDDYERRIKELEDQTLPISKGGTGVTTLEGAQAKLGITELREQVEKKLAEINDYTTGGNLILGSRDLTLGTTTHEKMIYRTDGFSLNPDNGFSFYRDEDGFMVGHAETTGQTSVSAKNLITSTFSGFKAGEIMTISCEVMIDDLARFDEDSASLMVVIYDTSRTTGGGGTYPELYRRGDSIAHTVNGTLESGVWKECLLHLTVPEGVKEDTPMVFSMRLEKNGSIYYKKPMVQQGKIKRPLWGPDARDLAMQPFNDITSANNLIRNSRDFTLGTEGKVNSTYADGFGITRNDPTLSYEITDDEDGFKILTLTRTGTTTSFNGFFSNQIRGMSVGEVLTIAFYLRINNNTPTADSIVLRVVEVTDTATKSSANYTIKALTGLETIKVGEWLKCQIHYTVKASDAYCVAVGLTAWNAGSYSFKTPSARPGKLFNSAWAYSVFDVSRASVEKSKPLPLLAQINISDQNQDFDNLTELTTYSIRLGAENIANHPAPGGYGTLINIAPFEDNRRIQMFYRWNAGGNPGVLYYREFNGAVWSPWATVLSTAKGVTIEQGGTNANSLAGAKTNLGITALEQKVATLEQQIAALIS